MKDTNKIKEISKRKYNVVLGLLLAIFSVILFINYTWLPRVFTFGFAYVLGMASYLIYILIYLFGMGLLFNFKLPKGRRVVLIFGSIFLVLGGIALATHISVSNTSGDFFNIVGKSEHYLVGFESNEEYINFNDAFNKVFFSFESGKNYITTPMINMLDSSYPVGGGLFGYLLLAAGNTLFKKAGGLVLAILFFLVSLIIYASPFVKTLIVNSKKKKPVHVEDEELIDINIEGTVEEKEPIYEDYNPSGYDQPKLSGNSFYLNNYDDTENGVFSKPVFRSSASNVAPSNNVADPDINHSMYNRPTLQSAASIASTVKEEKPVIPQEPVKHEQLSLDFDTKIDESLVIAQPEFNEIKPATPVVEQAPILTHIVPSTPAPAVQEVKKERLKWIAPSSDMLETYETADAEEANNAVAVERQRAIDEVFESFKIGARIEDYIVGSSVTRFNIRYQANVSSKSVGNIISDISIRLGGIQARFVPVVEGQTTSGLEVPNARITTVSFKEVYDGLPDVKKHPLAVAFGKNISGKIISADFDEFPHLLVAGTTGSGKSIFVNSLIATLIMRNSPDDLKVVLVDPKTVEMTRYKDMPHLLRPILYTAEEALAMGKKLVEEMERRYKLFGESGATNIKEYNSDCEKSGVGEKIPYIIFVLDEYADLVDQKKELSLPVVSLAQKARACGIHLLISTQRPSTNVVTGTIKANLPTHVALMTSNSTDSITIIGEGGAEKLLGKGDMLVQSPLVSRVGAVRLQGCYASRDEIIKVVRYLKEHYPTVYDPKFLDLEEEAEAEAEEFKSSPEFQASKDGGEEARYQQIKEWVMAQEYMSISRIQRECAVGFNRAGRFFTRMQQEGIVDTKVDGNRGCKVLKSDKFGDDEVVMSDEQSYFREDD